MTTNVNIQLNACEINSSRVTNNNNCVDDNLTTNSGNTRNDCTTYTNVPIDDTCKQKICKHSETFTLFITKFTLIDTA